MDVRYRYRERDFLTAYVRAHDRAMGCFAFGRSVSRAPFFYIAYILWLAVAILNTSDFASLIGRSNVVYYLVPFLLLIHELCRFELTRRDLVALAVLVVLNVQTYVWGGNDLFALSLFVYCGRRIDFASIAKVTIVVQSLITAFVIMSWGFGLVENTVDMRLDGQVRHSLGFSYVTYLSYVLLNVVLLRMYLTRGDMSYAELAFLAFLNVLTLALTDARNGCGLIFIALGLAFLLRGKSLRLDRHAVVRWLLTYSLVIFAAIFIVLSVFYVEGGPLASLDAFFSRRLFITNEAIAEYGIPLVGGTEWSLVESGTTIDSSYLRVVFEHGFVMLVVVLVVMTRLQQIAFMRGDYWLMLCLFFVAAHSMFDAQLISLQHNTFLLLIGPWLIEGCHRRRKAKARVGLSPSCAGSGIA